MSFYSLGLSSELQYKLKIEDYKQPYPIQQLAIPPILEGKDVLGIAKTGSGKTASYVLPILQNQQKKKTSKNRHISVLIMVPTRELAVQVEETVKLFSSALPSPIKSMAVFGGVSINPQMIKMNGVEILVATPGRLLELIEKKSVFLSEVRTLVLDEADKMLNMGFKEEMNRVLGLLPVMKQSLLFSATLSPALDGISQLILKQPQVVKVEEKETDIELISQKAYALPEEKKGPFLRYLIKKNKLWQVLVFVSSTYKADAVAKKLQKNGLEALAIHSKKSQGARTEALARFKSGKTRVLVTTDLLARGIDIEFLPYVVNYELPRSPKDFIHRIGRTGRAESEGQAFTFVTPDDDHHFKVIQKKMKKQVELEETDTIDLRGY